MSLIITGSPISNVVMDRILDSSIILQALSTVNFQQHTVARVTSSGLPATICVMATLLRSRIPNQALRTFQCV